MLLRYKDHNEYETVVNHRFFSGSRAVASRQIYYNGEIKNTTIRLFADILYTSRVTSETLFIGMSENNATSRSGGVPSSVLTGSLSDRTSGTPSFSSASVTPVTFILTVDPSDIFRLYANGEMLGEFTQDVNIGQHVRYQLEVKLEENGLFRFWVGNLLKLEVFANFQTFSNCFYIGSNSPSIRYVSSFAIWDDRDDGVDFFKGFLPDFKTNLLDATSQGTELNGKLVITLGAFAEEYNPADYGTTSKLAAFTSDNNLTITATGHPYFGQFYLANRYSQPGTDLYKFLTLVRDSVFGTGKLILGVLYRNHTLQAGKGNASLSYVVKNGALKYELLEYDKILSYTLYHYEYYSEFTPFPSFAKNPITGNNWTESEILNYEFGIKYSPAVDTNTQAVFVDHSPIAIVENLELRNTRLAHAHTFAAISDFSQSIHTTYMLYSNITDNATKVSSVSGFPVIRDFEAKIDTFVPFVIGKRKQIRFSSGDMLVVYSDDVNAEQRLQSAYQDVIVEDTQSRLTYINNTVFFDLTGENNVTRLQLDYVGSIAETGVQLFSTNNAIEDNSSRIMNAHSLPAIEDNSSRIMNAHSLPSIQDNGSRIMNAHSLPILREDVFRLNGALVFYVTTEVL